MARGPKALQGTRVAGKSEGKSCKYVVSIDFGTTFSGVAFAKLTDLDSIGSRYNGAVSFLDNWPGQARAGAKAYCKTQTSVWYMPGVEPGTFELKGWGWMAYIGYNDSLQNFNVGSTAGDLTRTVTRHLERRYQKCGRFVDKFKLGLAGRPLNLPDGLKLKRVISDFLRELSSYVLSELRNRYGRDAGSHREIQYILTVPVMWTPNMRHEMKACAEMAGMIAGGECKDNTTASPHVLKIVSEPEAAALQVHKTLETSLLKNGEKFMLVDVGGGTTDIALYEKIGSTTRRNFRVKEVSVSIGELIGGIHVDEKFFTFMRKTIGCLSTFEKQNPHYIIEMNRVWNGFKSDFGSSEQNFPFRFPLQRKLAIAMEKFDRASGGELREDYDFLQLTSKHLKAVFDPVVDRIIDLIHGKYVPGLTAIIVVGGFSESPYLQQRIKQAFDDKTNTVFMRNAGSAVVQGATLYGATKECAGKVTTRIAPRTIGYDTTKSFIDGKHNMEFLVVDKNTQRKRCDNIFGVIIRIGQGLPDNYVYKARLSALYRKGKEDGNEIVINLYETKARNPLYVTDRGVKKLTSCCILVPSRASLGEEAELELSVHFGTLMRATVTGINFTKKVKMPTVLMKFPTLEETQAEIETCREIVVRDPQGDR